MNTLLSKIYKNIKHFVKEFIGIFRPTKMLKSIKYTLIYMDKINLLIVLSLVVFGSIMIFSASSAYIYNGAAYSAYHFFYKQIIWIIMSGIAFICVIAIPYYELKKLWLPFAVFNIFALVAVFLFGEEFNNARSWFDLGFMTIQPVEFVKIGLIIFLAYFFEKNQEHATKYNLKIFLNVKRYHQSILFVFIYILIIIGLIVIQPDLGSAIAILFISITIIFVSGISGKDLLKILATVLILGGPAIYVVLNYTNIIKPYQLNRFLAWIDPFSFYESYAYQLINGYIAIAVGGIFGSGLGNSDQKFGFIAEPYNDFIATIIAEELGLIGIILLITLYFLLVYRCIKIALQSHSIFGALVSIGIGVMIFAQAFINLGGVCGLIPLTGITLPFISYGGSSLLSMIIGFAILQSVSAHNNFINAYNNKMKSI